MPRWLHVSIIGLLCCVSVALGQAAPAGFDLDATRLPPRYIGMSLARLATQLQVRPQGEYESTVEYDRRRLSAAPDVIVTRIQSTCRQYRVDYDPDTETLAVEVWASSAGSSPYLFLPIMAACSTADLGRTPMTNAYGVTVSVLRRREHAYLLYADIPGSNSIAVRGTVSLSVPRARAATTRSRLAVLAVAAPDLSMRALVTTDTARSRPTFDSRTDYTLVSTAIRVRDLAFWIFDSSSGRVIAKLPVTLPCVPDHTGICVLSPTPLPPN